MGRFKFTKCLPMVPLWMRPSRLVTTLLILLFFSGTMVFVALSVSLFSDIWRAQNRSQDAKDAYAAAAKRFDSANVYTWVPGTMSIGDGNSIATRSAEIVSIPVPLQGDTTGVPSETSIVGQAVLPISIPSPNILVNFTVSLRNFTPPIFRYAQVTKRVSTGAICSPKSGSTCNETVMQAYCTTTYGPFAAYVGSSYCRAGGCGDCYYYAYLTDYCLVVDSIGAGTSSYRVVADPSWLSCHYPFTDDTQQSYAWTFNPPTSVSVTIYRSDDPWIQLQLQTSGSCLFEKKSLSATKVYLAMSGVGAVLTFLIFIALYTYMRRTWGEGAADHQRQGRLPIPVTFGTSRSFIFSNGAVEDDRTSPAESARDHNNTTVGRGVAGSTWRAARSSAAGALGSGLTTTSFASSMASGYSGNGRGDSGLGSPYNSTAGPSISGGGHHSPQQRNYNDISTYGREPIAPIVGFSGKKSSRNQRSEGGAQSSYPIRSGGTLNINGSGLSTSSAESAPHLRSSDDNAPLLGDDSNV